MQDASPEKVLYKPLFRPERITDLVTEPVLRKLLLGFSAGLGGMPVALQDRHRMYDLWGEPSEWWCAFCRDLRSVHKQDEECRKWDMKVAHILLGLRQEEYTGQAAEFRRGPFHCHAHMLDLAATICLAGRPFAVLHGGQLPPYESGWKSAMRRRLASLVVEEAGTQRLIELVEQAAISRQSDPFGTKEQQLLSDFAREVEDLLNDLYQRQRSASEEGVLSSLRDALVRAPRTDWSSWWCAVSGALVGLCGATAVNRVSFLVGSDKGRFVLHSMASSQEGWDLRPINVGPFWQAIRHGPVLLAAQPWAAKLRDCAGLTSSEPCLIAPAFVRANSTHSFAAALLAVGDEVTAQGMDAFVARLASGLGRRTSETSQAIELEETRSRAAEFAAMSGHHVNAFLHAATFTAAGISYDLERLGIRDPGLLGKSAKLERLLEQADADIQQLQHFPVTDINVSCVLKPLDILTVIDRIMPVANTIGEECGVKVKWTARPPAPVVLLLDDRYMGTALLAILENAVKYSFDSTEVRVSARVYEQWFVLEISNLGVGIPPEQMEHVFSLRGRAEVLDTKRRDRPGTGLGLPIARHIAIAHRGALELQSVSTRDPVPVPDDYLSHKVTATMRLPVPPTQAGKKNGVTR